MSASYEQAITLTGDLHARPAGALAVAAGNSRRRYPSPWAPAASTPRASSASWAWARPAASTSPWAADGPDAEEAVATIVAILAEATKVGGLLRNQAGRCTR